MSRLYYYIRRQETKTRARSFWNAEERAFVPDSSRIAYFQTRSEAVDAMKALNLTFTALRLCCSCAKHVEFRRQHPVQETCNG